MTFYGVEDTTIFQEAVMAKVPTDKQVEKEIASLEAEIEEYRNGEAGTDEDRERAIESLEDRLGGIKWARGVK